MITTNQELYGVVREIIEALKNAGEAELASDLHGALAISSLPGEVLGETRFQLERVKRSKVADRVDLRRAVDEAIRYVSSALDG